MDEEDKHTHTNTNWGEYYSAIKKNEIMPFAATRADPDKHHVISLICRI